MWASGSELLYLLDALAQPRFANFQTKDGSLLSARETEVVGCLAEGFTNREIAQRLKLTEHTVKNYLFRIFDASRRDPRLRSRSQLRRPQPNKVVPPRFSFTEAI